MASPGALVGVVVGAPQAPGGGGGTINPPLTTVTQSVSGGFSGSLNGVSTNGVVSDSCNFTFASGAGGVGYPLVPTGNALGGDNAAYGAGNASGSCSGTVAVSASLGYTRVGPVVAITGQGSAGSTTAGLDAAVCVFIPTSAPAVSTFDLVCVTAAAGAN
jgi:hypothetical protein